MPSASKINVRRLREKALAALKLNALNTERGEVIIVF